VTITTHPTSHDVREAERRALDMRLGLIHGAPPLALDPAGNRHALRLAQVWGGIARVHAEYAAELERREGRAA
jgi:hypothetical protein